MRSGWILMFQRLDKECKSGCRFESHCSADLYQDFGTVSIPPGFETRLQRKVGPNAPPLPLPLPSFKQGIEYFIHQTPFAQPTTPSATALESSLCALSTPSPPRFQCVSVQAKRGTYLLPRPLPGKEGGTLGLPKASVPSFSRQSGQYHFALRAGICVMPTHSKWNHSLSHCCAC
jgi:hypothetical protein